VEATWELIASGVTGPGEIQTRTGYSETASPDAESGAVWTQLLSRARARSVHWLQISMKNNWEE
jgi:hypothetical protein